MIRPFEKGERICFIGSSTTALTSWISHMADFYAKCRPNDKIFMLPCGVSGGGFYTANPYYKEQVAIWEPTTIVLMLATNDIERHHYGAERTEEMIKNGEAAMERYKTNLYRFIEMLKAQPGIKRIIHISPNPYDELQISDEKNLVGCQAALRRCADITREAAKEYGDEFYDLNRDMYDIMCEMKERDSDIRLISRDRVHATELGFCVQARLILAAQGFYDMHVSADDVISGKAMLYRSEKAQKFHDAAYILQERWSAEWNIGNISPDKSIEGKIKFANEFASNEENSNYLRGLAERYEKHVNCEKSCCEELAKAIDALYID